MHDLSYRKIPEAHPPESSDTTIVEWFEPAECQYHVHVFEGRAGSWFGCHYETRPDIFAPSYSIERLQTHYRPVYGDEFLLGVTDLRFGETPV